MACAMVGESGAEPMAKGTGTRDNTSMTRKVDMGSSLGKTATNTSASFLMILDTEKAKCAGKMLFTRESGRKESSQAKES